MARQPQAFQLHVLFMLLGSFSLSVAFRFLRPFFRFQVPFRQGRAAPNRLYLNAKGGTAFRLPYPTLPPTSAPGPLLLSHPLFRVTEGDRTQHTCVCWCLSFCFSCPTPSYPGGLRQKSRSLTTICEYLRKCARRHNERAVARGTRSGHPDFASLRSRNALRGFRGTHCK